MLEHTRIDERDWRLQGHCRYLGDVFYAPENESLGVRLRRERTARSICAQCPVNVRCRDHALRNREEHGIWGGLTELERNSVRRPHRRPSRMWTAQPK
ncbi:WhiB family redox-sensing transcriptional regulator [Rhodococcus sp. 27YEA15]|uniref:WhiB family transcriptional regulator n=1 Tax=Rhodococcus sp. 27YEA15 TaxID=3156259 RepID=UPI003C7DEB7C